MEERRLHLCLAMQGFYMLVSYRTDFMDIN